MEWLSFFHPLLLSSAPCDPVGYAGGFAVLYAWSSTHNYQLIGEKASGIMICICKYVGANLRGYGSESFILLQSFEKKKKN